MLRSAGSVWALYVSTVSIGLGITLQTTLNAQLAKGVGGDSVAAVLFSFTAGALLSYVVLASKVGLSALLGLAIAGQIISSLFIYHFGLLGTTERPVSLIKLGGLIVMLTGLAVALLGDKLSAFFSS